MEGNKPTFKHIPEIKAFWDKFAFVYSATDSATLTFYYTLVHMLQLPLCKHILEVGMGTGKLIPQALLLKPSEATYLATDLSPEMVAHSMKSLQDYICKIGVKDSLTDWMDKQHLTVQVTNGEETQSSGFKFDRIIANLVVHTTEDPAKMMKNFHDVAEEGCLLGLSIWGSPQENNWFRLVGEGLRAQNKHQPNARTPFHLYNKLEELADATGWEVVQSWQQNAPWPFISVDQNLKAKAHFQGQSDEKVEQYVVGRAQKILEEKKVLNISCQMVILRRK